VTSICSRSFSYVFIRFSDVYNFINLRFEVREYSAQSNLRTVTYVDGFLKYVCMYEISITQLELEDEVEVSKHHLNPILGGKITLNR
jgi:hypothetical protein